MHIAKLAYTVICSVNELDELDGVYIHIQYLSLHVHVYTSQSMVGYRNGHGLSLLMLCFV